NQLPVNVRADLSVKPLIRLVERGDWDVDDLQFADSAVAATRFDEHRAHGFEWVERTVEFHLSLAFEHEVNLRHPLMIMRTRIFLDVHNVERRGAVVRRGKGAF